jgi:hypothetical protein
VFEVLNFKKGATIIKLTAAVTNLNVQEILIPHCTEIRTWKIHHLTG